MEQVKNDQAHFRVHHHKHCQICILEVCPVQLVALQAASERDANSPNTRFLKIYEIVPKMAHPKFKKKLENSKDSSKIVGVFEFFLGIWKWAVKGVLRNPKLIDRYV